jgi:hypothetical protein
MTDVSKPSFVMEKTSDNSMRNHLLAIRCDAAKMAELLMYNT